METLSWSGPTNDRIVHMALDEELDRYRVLAYLQRVDGRYREHKLYPHLDELRQRLEQLMELRQQRELLQAAPRTVHRIDLQRNELVYSRPAEDELLNCIDAMIDFALPGLRRMLELGSELREELSTRIRFSPVGVLPLSTQEGYILLRHGHEASVYAYAMPLWHGIPEALRYRSVRTRFVTTCTVDLSHPYERIKADLVRVHRHLPNPATFVFETDMTLPRVETFMPLAKQLVYEVIAPRAV